MRLAFKEHNPLHLKRARRIFRRSPVRQCLSVRNGRVYTMRYNPGVQPRTESQVSNWSLFKQANRLVAADFRVESRRAYWHDKLRRQSRYKTARGLARAFYIAVLKRRVATKVTPDAFLSRRVSTLVRPDVRRVGLSPSRSLRPSGRLSRLQPWPPPLPSLQNTFFMKF